jgi:pilus assembly protein CpaE
MDLPRHMIVQHPHLINEVHVAILVVEFTLAATRDAIRILSWLKANAPQAKVVVVANRVSAAHQEISRKDFEQSIERKVDICIPLDLKSAGQAAKLGQPFAKVATGAKTAQPLAQLVTMTVSSIDVQDESADETKGAASLMDKLNLKGLLAKTAKPAKTNA